MPELRMRKDTVTAKHVHASIKHECLRYCELWTTTNVGAQLAIAVVQD